MGWRRRPGVLRDRLASIAAVHAVANTPINDPTDPAYPSPISADVFQLPGWWGQCHHHRLHHVDLLGEFRRKQGWIGVKASVAAWPNAAIERAETHPTVPAHGDTPSRLGKGEPPRNFGSRLSSWVRSVEIGGANDPGRQPICRRGTSHRDGFIAGWRPDHEGETHTIRGRPFDCRLDDDDRHHIDDDNDGQRSDPWHFQWGVSDYYCEPVATSVRPLYQGDPVRRPRKGLQLRHCRWLHQEARHSQGEQRFPHHREGWTFWLAMHGVAKQDRSRLHRAVFKERKLLQRTLLFLDCRMSTGQVARRRDAAGSGRSTSARSLPTP